MGKTKGYEQLTAIIGEIMENQKWTSWDFVNGVLSCKEILGETNLWFHWGKLLIVPPDKQYGARAKDLEELKEWNTMPDGRIELFGGDWGDDD